MQRLQWALLGAATTLLAGVGILQLDSVRFLAGGAMVNAGYRFQDSIDAYDFQHDEAHITAQQVWEEFQAQNQLAAGFRENFPRTTHHPPIAMLLCMDARIDVNDLTGDTRLEYYVVRTAGSVIGPAEAEMLELAADKGVKLIVLTRHTDCAAEKAAADPAAREKYPALTYGVEQRDQRVREFLARPSIAARIASGDLIVKELVVDTKTERLLDPSEVDHLADAPPADHGGEHH